MTHLPPSNLCFPTKVSAEYCWHMIWRIAFVLGLSLLLSSCATKKQKPFDLGRWNPNKIEQLQNQTKNIPHPGEKVALISAAFLQTPYLASTLIGTAETKEVFVLRLDRVDCFTYLDYVEALRRSTNFNEFKQALRQVRYNDGEVTFLNRHHFFSSWGNAPLAPLRDVTSQVGGTNTRWVEKQLNKKKDGTRYLPGYPIKKQIIAYIPPETIDQSVLNKLHNGDYIGIYSPLPGLDVSHTGIVIRKKGKIYLRHASTKQSQRQVMDELLLPYLDGKKGLIIYRPVANYGTEFSLEKQDSTEEEPIKISTRKIQRAERGD